MNKNILYLILIGLISLFSSCEKDENKAILSSSPEVPSITTFPELTLQRTKGTDTLKFAWSPVNPGFQVSANYFLEACLQGNNFADAVTINSGGNATSFNITVGDLNTILLKKFDADKVSSVDFRVRSALVGAVTTVPLVYSSAIKNVNVTVFGLPRLDLMAGTEVIGKVESALGDGKYIGYVKLDITKPITFKNPDANITYGGSAGNLAVNGTTVTPGDNGWNKITVNTNDLKYTIEPYRVGVVGAFTEWGTNPDKPMEYDTKNGYWVATVDLPPGPMKFRLNSAWDVNWGPGSTTNLPADGSILLPNSSGDINITTAGNYTIMFTITGTGTSGSGKFVKNN